MQKITEIADHLRRVTFKNVQNELPHYAYLMDSDVPNLIKSMFRLSICGNPYYNELKKLSISQTYFSIHVEKLHFTYHNPIYSRWTSPDLIVNDPNSAHVLYPKYDYYQTMVDEIIYLSPSACDVFGKTDLANCHGEYIAYEYRDFVKLCYEQQPIMKDGTLIGWK